ncbi:hypothetical protein E4T80_10005 [Muribacter muris]|uniref:Large polyvalent protein associated domain-containing protein n=1 Tax=Muribacter muris TaxID=67855 RepID=A0A4Y9JS16_9PAST|nr:LPD38 domain-containing protein [Muribacter muris]MBF0785793.1 hypothetical protein [Muribacter muris]MBF0828235.1 hypothetical protein [Muribacter muris]TFV08614.1 hypothetical protein E4T80_10005 [Muribacter muris]
MSDTIQLNEFQNFSMTPEQKAYFDLMAKPTEDVTGFGIKQAEDFNRQMAAFPNVTPIQRFQAFENFKNDWNEQYIRNGYSSEQIAKINAEFNSLADPRNQEGFVDQLKGFGHQIGAGFEKFAGNIQAAFNPEWAEDNIKAAEEHRKQSGANAQISQYLQQQEQQALQQNGSSEFGATVKSFVNNPRALIGTAAEELTPYLATGAAAAVAAPFTGGASLAFAPAVMGGTGAFTEAGAYRLGMQEKINAMSKEQLMALPEIQSRLQSGMTFEQAKADYATDFSDHAVGTAAAAGIGALESMTGVGKLGSKLGLGGAVKTLIKEPVLQAGQEALAQLNQNLGYAQIDPNQNITENVQSSAAVGGLLGIGSGTISAASQLRSEPESQTSTDKPQIENDITKSSVQPQPTDTAQTTPQSVDEKALETVLTDYKNQAEEADYKEMYDELKSDILDGKIHERAAEDYGDTQYRDFARAYLAQTGQVQSEAQPTQAVETEQDFANSEQQTVEQPKLNEERLQQYRTEVNELLAQRKAENLSEQGVVARYSRIVERFPDHNTLAEELYRREQEDNEQQVLFSRSPMKSVEANIARGRERMTKAILDKADVKRGMYHGEFGWVDFVWGDDGVTKGKNRFGEPRGRGISHVIEARMRKDGLTEDQATQMLTNDIVDTIARGTGSKKVMKDNSERLQLNYTRPTDQKTHRAILTKNKGSNAWVLTGYEVFEDATRPQFITTSPTDTHRTLQRDEAGASNVASDSEQFANPNGLSNDTALELGRPTNTSQLNDTHAHSQRGRGVVAENGVNLANYDNVVNQVEQDQQTLSRILGEETARHVYIVDSNTEIPTGHNVKKLAEEGIEGWFDIGSQKLYLISDNITETETLSRDERLAWVAWHELAHAGVRMKYGRALKNLLSSAGKNPVVSVLARRIQAERAKLGETLSREVAIEEAMAELYATTETGNWAALESRYHMRIAPSWKKGKDNVRDFLAKIANLFRRLIGGVIRRDVSQTMTTGQVFDTLSGIKQGIADIAQNQAEPTAYNGESNVESRYSLNENPDSEFANAVPKRMASSFDEARAAVTELLGEPLVNKETGMIATISKRSLDKLVSGKASHKSSSTHDHLMAVANIDQLFENAIDGWIEPAKSVDNTSIAGVHKMFAPLNIDGVIKLAKLTVKEFKDNSGNRIYSVETIEIGDQKSSVPELTASVQDERTLVGLHRANVESLIQQIKNFNSRKENSTAENEGDIRYSRKQSTLDTIKAGKIEHNDDPTIFGNIKSGNFSEAWKTLTRNADFLLTDETRPVVEWVNGLDLSRAEQVDILSELDRADGIRHALNATVSQRFLKPLQQNIAALAKKHKKEVDWTKHVVESYISAKWSITRNRQILAREQKAMEEAKTAMEVAQREALLAEEGSDKRYAEATRAYRRAERRYLDRKHDIELKNWETDEHGDFVVKRKVGVAGWSIPHAQAIMAEAEKHFSAQEMEQAAKPIRQAVSWNIAKNVEANRITAEQAAEYRKHPDYVPLTGDPDRADNDDFIGGASQRGVNTARDKAQKGRTNSEAEGAIDAVYKMLDKTIANYAWQPFKNKVNEVYEQALSEEKDAGKSDEQAKKAVAARTGIERAIFKGTTRPSDDVLIRKYGNVYYEYRLPEAVITALKGSQRNETDYKLGKFFALTGIKTLTGLYAQGVTQFKPMFAPKNMIRDVWEKSALLTTREIIGADGKDLSQKAKNRIGRKTFSALYNLKETARLMKATKALAKGDTENLNTKDEYQRDLKELIKLGGVSNYSTYLARTEKDLVSEIEKLNNPRGRFVEGAKHLVALWNGTFDYVSSLAAYRALKAEGVSAERAAAIVLNLSNFRKQGWAAKHFKPLYMFLNPTLQGGKNIVQMMSTKQGWLYLAGRTTMAMAVWSLLMSLDDEDEETGKRMFANGDLSREILIPTGEKDRYIRVPVGYGAPQVVNNLAVNLVALMNNQITAADAFANIVAHNAKSVMPVSPSEISASKYPLEKLADTLTPTMFKSLTQWVMDRNAFGNRIKPSFVQGDKLLSQQSKSTTAEFWQETAKWMQDNLGFDAHPEAYKHIFDSYRGMMGVLGDFASAVIENPNREMHGKSTIMPIVQDFFGIKGENRASNLYYEYKGEAQELMKEFNYHKENGTLAQWRTPEKMRAVLWNQKADSEINRFRKLKAKLNKDKGKISDETYATRLQRYNQNIERIHRKMVYEWRKQQDLHTVRTP